MNKAVMSILKYGKSYLCLSIILIGCLFTCIYLKTFQATEAVVDDNLEYSLFLHNGVVLKSLCDCILNDKQVESIFKGRQEKKIITSVTIVLSKELQFTEAIKFAEKAHQYGHTNITIKLNADLKHLSDSIDAKKNQEDTTDFICY